MNDRSHRPLRVAISTSGGDAPGLNAVIRGVTTSGIARGYQIFGIRNGFDSLLRDDLLIPLNRRLVEGIERHGGTILGAASGGSPFGRNNEGLVHFVEALQMHEIDALVIAGGDGSMGIAATVAERSSIQVVGVPKTIDRDLVETYTTFGFDSATSIATEAIDRIHTTAASHDRVMVVEVMGRDSGWIALHAGIAAGAHMIAIPEIPYDLEAFADHIRARESRGHRYHILVCAEGARPAGGEAARSERTERYGGLAERLATRLAELTGKDTRSLVLGHLLRGGSPTVFDRVLGLRLGSAAVQALHRGESRVMVAFNPPGIGTVPLEAVVGRTSTVPVDGDEIATARDLGVSFGALAPAAPEPEAAPAS